MVSQKTRGTPGFNPEFNGMQITVNGETKTIDAGTTVAALLERFDLTPQRVAVEVNEQLVKRATFSETQLAEGDRIEIVTLVGGG